MIEPNNKYLNELYKTYLQWREQGIILFSTTFQEYLDMIGYSNMDFCSLVTEQRSLKPKVVSSNLTRSI